MTPVTSITPTKIVGSIVLAIICLIIAAISLGRIGTGNVGVRTNFNKSIDMEELSPGWYGAFFTSVDECVIKETELSLENMRPKAGDGLSLHDLDISVFYTVAPASVAEMFAKYSNMSVGVKDLWYPAFLLVERVSRGAVYDAVGQMKSLSVGAKRAELEESIRSRVQADLDKGDPGVFVITRVVVRQVLTDPALELPIQEAVSVQKRIEAKQGEIDLARQEAERQRVETEGTAHANKILSESLTDRYIAYKQVEALSTFATVGTHTVLMPMDSKAMLNIGK